MEVTNVMEYEAIAKQKLPKMVYDYYASGAEDQWTLAENRNAFSRILFCPRILIDVSNIDMSTTVLGFKISMPIMIAPTAMQKMAHPEGEYATARAASPAGTIMGSHRGAYSEAIVVVKGYSYKGDRSGNKSGGDSCFESYDQKSCFCSVRHTSGKFRHLPVVENGEVIALLDIAKCLYDAIASMDRAAEKGKAIAAAVEGVEKSWGSSASATDFQARTTTTKCKDDDEDLWGSIATPPPKTAHCR
ncbi:hypothetical protein Droror1_Dr00026705 [Drosera rotundifolia]